MSSAGVSAMCAAARTDSASSAQALSAVASVTSVPGSAAVTKPTVTFCSAESEVLRE